MNFSALPRNTLGFDADLAAFAGYSEEELEAMVESARSKYGTLGDLVIQDVDAMVDGINAYLDTLNSTAISEIPPEYATLALQVVDLPSLPPVFPPRDWTRTDIVASATLIQSIFAIGGGGEHQNLRLLQALDAGFGPDSPAVPEAACALWRDLRHANDPDTHYSINAATFETQSPASVSEACPQPLPQGAAIFDPGSFETPPDLPGRQCQCRRDLGCHHRQCARRPVGRCRELAAIVAPICPPSAPCWTA